MQRKKLYVIAPALILALTIILSPIGQTAMVQYSVLASFDFLSTDEISNFDNVTLAGGVWNTTLTTYSVLNGQLNISNKDTADALLVYPVTLNGYAEITLTEGTIAVFSNYNQSATVLTGYEVVKDSSGITVYSVNGTSKSAVASLTTTAQTIVVGVQDGKLSIKLSDGTGIYEAPFEDAVIAFGAPASDGTNPTYGVFDKVVLYGTMLSGTIEIDLGSKTVTPTSRVASFTYDVSQYKDITTAKLVVTFTAADDPYARYYIITTSDPGQTFWKTWPSTYLDKGEVMGRGTAEVDVLNTIQSSPTGTFYVGVSVGTGSWTVSAKLVLDAVQSSESGTSDTSTTSPTIEVLLVDNWKYIAAGAGALVLLILIFAFMTPKGKKGIAPLLAAFFMLLVLGGIAVAVLAWLHPEWLFAAAMGIGALAIIVLMLMLNAGKKIPNPVKAS